ncbi:ankyrin repeat-containing protein ITN1-like [Aristolochia californica]|uniref:ankyrin repeat-containing protein ITN1-like n=1 Tax=Aristolochia californica TaxID=171875 RepID=UPI0035DA0515
MSTEFRDAGKLYEAAIQGKKEVLMAYEPGRWQLPVTPMKDTLLHLIVTVRHEELVKDIINNTPQSEIYKILKKKNQVRNNILHELATTEMVEVAKQVLNKLTPEQWGNLINKKNYWGETPVFRTAVYGSKKMFLFLTEHVKDSTAHLRRDDGMTMLHAAILGESYDFASLLFVRHESLADKIDKYGQTGLHLLAKTPSAFKSRMPYGFMKRLIYHYAPAGQEENNSKAKTGDNANASKANRVVSKIFQVIPVMKRISDEKRKHGLTSTLMEALVETDKSWKQRGGGGGILLTDENLDKDIGQLLASKLKIPSKRGTDIPLFLAIEHGIMEIVEETVNKHPQVLDFKNQFEQNVLHIAVNHRQQKIFEFLIGKKLPTTNPQRSTDRGKHSILHYAAADRSQEHEDAAGPVQKLQRELQWFERVKNSVPAHFLDLPNIDQKIPQELLMKGHSKLHEEAKDWLKETADSCSIVAVLIATVAFAAAYTVPGGTDKVTGLPVLLHMTSFLVFTVMDVLSLVASLTAVAILLSVLTSPFQLLDFHTSLPRKLVFGLTFLFISIATMMLAFAATIIITIHLDQKWLTLLLYTVSHFPVTIFILLHLPLYISLAKESLAWLSEALPALYKL